MFLMFHQAEAPVNGKGSSPASLSAEFKLARSWDQHLVFKFTASICTLNKFSALNGKRKKA